LTRCFFVSDLHGLSERYLRLFKAIEEECPAAVFMGGDILPSGMFYRYQLEEITGDFIHDFVRAGLENLRAKLQEKYPRIFVILGNDDPGMHEADIIAIEKSGLWEYIHEKAVEMGEYTVFGYAYVPPTPFLLKDWERYDVSRYIDPGDISPEEGKRSMPIPKREAKFSLIKTDLERLTEKHDLENAVFLFHTPPYQTNLDRVASDGQMVDYVPLDVNVGSIAVKRFIESRQPLVTLHGHIHESATLTGSWRDFIGRTHLFSAAHDGPELCLVRFDLENLADATRELI
jgi:Icc-related predicted phosphoesterase